MTTHHPCAGCGAPLIGDEVPYETCGHCGGRSLDPNRRRTQIATLTGFKTQPTSADLDRIEAAYRSEGFAHPIAIPASGGRGWEVSVTADKEPHPYQGANA